jgi:prepilin-type N-terminal cleavage/methylation domain-containing protein
MKANAKSSKAHDGFTLIELLCVIAIIIILAGMLMPVTTGIVTRANDTKCANNLRMIGVAANALANDNENRYPIIEFDADGNEVSSSLGQDAQYLDVALKPYGIGPDNLICPADLKGPKNYLQSFAHNSSYMWSPYSEDNLASAPEIISQRRGAFQIPPSRLQLASDWQALHMSKDATGAPMIYAVYADGHVKTSRRTSSSSSAPGGH